MASFLFIFVLFTMVDGVHGNQTQVGADESTEFLAPHTKQDCFNIVFAV